MKPSRLSAAGLGLVLLTVSMGALALERGRTGDERPYVSGGIGQDEANVLQAERAGYSLWVTTAAKGSGAYLSDVQLTIVDARQRVVFDRALDGPWLMVDLAAGRYTVRAASGGEQHEAVTTVHAGDHHAMVFYFTVAADVPPAAARAASRAP